MRKFGQELRRTKLVNFVMLFFAGVINAFGVTLFLFPMKLYDSGISGLSMLLDQITPPYLTLPIFLLVINLPIFIFGMKRQGVPFTVYSIFAIGVYSAMSYLIVNVLPIDVAFVSPLAGDDLLLCAIFGGVISGIGSGLTIRFGGAIDGIDVLSVVFAKRIGLSIGTFVMVFNAALYIVCGFVIQSWILPLYSVVTYFIGSKTIDFVVDGIDQSTCAMIVTVKADEITDEMRRCFDSCGTIMKAKGGYSKEEKDVVYYVMNSYQVYRLKQLVREVDPDAYMSLHNVYDVQKGQAFGDGN